MKKIAFFFIFSLVLLSCEKGEFPDPGTLPDGLAGSWVETHTLEDTIVFNSDRDTGFFYLSRGFEMRNGYWLPKIGSAPYSYIMKEDSILVINGLSSSLLGGTYYFRFDEPDLTIYIGKFSKYIDTKKSTLTFRKIR
jgi:hypothetical protein